MSQQMLESLKPLQATKAELTNFNSMSDVNLKTTIFDNKKHTSGVQLTLSNDRSNSRIIREFMDDKNIELVQELLKHPAR